VLSDYNREYVPSRWDPGARLLHDGEEGKDAEEDSKSEENTEDTTKTETKPAPTAQKPVFPNSYVLIKEGKITRRPATTKACEYGFANIASNL